MRIFNTTLTAIATVITFALVAVGQATVLEFDIDLGGYTPGGFETTYDDYGDSVNSLTQISGPRTYTYSEGNGFTPNINLDYSSNAEVIGISNYTGAPWDDVAFLVGNGATTNANRQFYFGFSPDDPKFGVRINSFELFRFTNNQNQEVDWTIYQDSIGGTILDSGNTGLFNTTFAAPLTVNTLGLSYYGTLILEIQHLQGSGGGFATNNINFDQIAPVPEPSSLLLLGLGALGLVRHTRRRRQRA